MKEGYWTLGSSTLLIFLRHWFFYILLFYIFFKFMIRQQFGHRPMIFFRAFRHRFWGCQGLIFKDFWITCWFLAYFGDVLGCSCWGGSAPPDPPALDLVFVVLVNSSANFAKKIQELAEDKAENPRTCRGQSREQNPYERLQENSNLKALFF